MNVSTIGLSVEYYSKYCRNYVGLTLPFTELRDYDIYQPNVGKQNVGTRHMERAEFIPTSNPMHLLLFDFMLLLIMFW